MYVFNVIMIILNLDLIFIFFDFRIPNKLLHFFFKSDTLFYRFRYLKLNAMILHRLEITKQTIFKILMKVDSIIDFKKFLSLFQ